MFNVTLVELEFSALSVAVPLMTWFAPIVVSVTGAGHVAIPESASEQVKVTVALPKLMLPTGAGVTTAVIVGGVLSRLTFTVVVPVLPEVSVTVPLTGWFAPSVLTMTGEGQLCTGYEPAVHVKVTVTLELFQPFAFGAGERVAVMDGGTAA
jgi:hypothetical protein